MDYSVRDGGIELSQPDFDLDQTLDCGQAFRWSKTAADSYTGFFLDRRLDISGSGGRFMLHDVSEREFLDVWADYFDLSTDYGELKRIFSEDETLSKACGFAGGIRLLRQDAWEALCSFIISQNNNIPRIKGIISRLCDELGGFPPAEKLSMYTADELSFLRAGFRAKYLVSASSLVAGGEISLEALRTAPIEEARAALMQIKGVGPKVAECALLYGMHRTEAFPVDVWIKRVLERYYPEGFPEFASQWAGIAQQYLFHYIRFGA